MRGGKRPNAGRKKNSGNQKYKFQSYFTKKEVRDIVKKVKEQAETRPELLKLIVEQLFGRPPQRMEMTGKDGEKLTIQISEEVAKKNGITSNSK